MHGQVKQSSNYAFARVYYSGHKVPFFQPLLALEFFERVINGKDVATGASIVDGTYKTVGTAESTFREGNATVQFDVVDSSATYNVTTGAPNPVASNGTAPAVEGQSVVARSTRAGAKSGNGKSALQRLNRRWK